MVGVQSVIGLHPSAVALACRRNLEIGRGIGGGIGIEGEIGGEIGGGIKIGGGEIGGGLGGGLGGGFRGAYAYLGTYRLLTAYFFTA